MLSDWAENKLREISYGYLLLKCEDGSCFGVLGAYRVCFATSLFHLIFIGLMWGVETSQDPRAKIQNGYWGFKLLSWIGLMILSFFIPNGFIMGWSRYINIPGATVFILIQVILLIDFAYSISEALLGWWEETDDRRYIGFLMFLTASCYILAIVMTGFMYSWFGSSSCRLNQFFISFNWVLFVTMSIISIIPSVQEANPRSGLAQSAMVSIYATYLIASALSSEPADELGICNPVVRREKTETTSMFLGSLFTFIVLVYSTNSAATTFNSDGSTEPLLSNVHLNAAIDSGAMSGNVQDNTENYPEDDEQDGVLYNYSFFHFVFMIGSMYLAMLITNWDSIVIIDGVAGVVKSMVSVWVKLGCIAIVWMDIDSADGASREELGLLS